MFIMTALLQIYCWIHNTTIV